MTYVIALPCVDLKDKTCIEECPVDCIYEGERMLYIHPGECIDCGACESVCRVQAIAYEEGQALRGRGEGRVRRVRFSRWRHRGCAGARPAVRAGPAATGARRGVTALVAVG